MPEDDPVSFIEDCFRYPSRGDDPVAPIVIGSVLSLLSGLLLPAIPLWGYFVAVLRTTIDGEHDPPGFTDVESLLVDGVVALAIGLVYVGIPTAVVGLLATLFFASGSVVGEEAGVALAVIGMVVFLLAIPILLVAAYVVPAAIAAYADRGRLGAAFDVGTLRRVLFSRDYLLAALVPIVVGVVANVVFSTVVSILAFTIVGLLLVVPLYPLLIAIQFYVSVAVFRMFGRAYARAVGIERAGTDPASATD